MHATLAYLNAASRRNVVSNSANREFWKLMHSLLANIHGVSHWRAKSPRPNRNAGS